MKIKKIYVFFMSFIQKSTIYPNQTPPRSLPCNLKPLPNPITASAHEAEHTTPKKNPALQGSKGSANNPRRDESNGKPHR